MAAVATATPGRGLVSQGSFIGRVMPATRHHSTISMKGCVWPFKTSMLIVLMMFGILPCVPDRSDPARSKKRGW